MTIKRKHLVIRIVAVLAALVVAMVAVEKSIKLVVLQQDKQMEQTLRDVGEQNGARLQAVMDARYMLLNAMCVQMSDESDPTYLIDQFKVLVPIYDVRHIGFADPDGMAYTTDGAYMDVSRWEAFRKASAGETLVADVMSFSGAGGGVENINVYAAPVHHYLTGDTMGVMLLTYRTETFGALLQMGSFGAEGTSCIFQSDGTVVAATGDGVLAAGDDLFRELLALDADNAGQIDALRRYMTRHGEDPALVTLSNGTEDYYFHITETAGRPGWYLATIVPTDVFTRRTEPMLRGIRQLATVITLLMLFCVLVYLWTWREQRRELFRLAYQDPVTGGDNYAAFVRKMAGDKKISGAGYVVSADLRDFDSIYHTCGTRRSEEIIRAMYRVMAERLEKGELLARVNDDRFVLFLHSADEPALIDRLQSFREEIQALSARLNLPQLLPTFGVRAVDSPQDPEGAYTDVKLALRRLNERVDYFYAIFNESDRQRADETRELENQFEKALKEHRFEMWYQPKYSPASGELVAAEALVRWRKADGSLIPPGKFIPLFERNGMIGRLDEYTFDAVCAQQKFWLDRGVKIVPVSVNISRVSLMFPDIAQRLYDILQSHALPIEYIELEITESAMEGKANMEEVIGQFREKGFKIQMDDFGSGYSSLYTLTKRYFDNVKIDKSLVDCIGDPEGDALIKSIIQLVHEFNMTVTAEGVEEEDQAKFLVLLSCDNIQGYFYSRPLPSVEFEKLLRGEKD